MRLYCLFLFFFLVSIKPLIAQEISLQRSINWQKNQKITLGENVSVEFLNFDGAIYDGSANFIPSYFEKINIPSNITSFKAKISHAVFEPLSDPALLKNKELVGSEIQVHAYVAYERKKPAGIVTFYPFRKNSATGAYEKLVSFHLSLTFTEGFQKMGSVARSYQTTSVLSTGNWFKIGLMEDGVYKLTSAFFNQLGLNAANINPKNIRIYGNGGGMLPLKNTDFRHDDLVENAIQVIGEDDNKFDGDDYVLFYGKGPHKWTYNATEKRFQRTYNFLSDSAFYFITVELGLGKRIAVRPSSVQAPTDVVSTFNDYAIHEENTYNFIKSGREWYGESFEILTTRNFTFNFPNLDVSSPVSVTSDVIAKSYLPSSFDLKVNGTQLLRQNIPAIGPFYYDDYAMLASGAKTNTISVGGANIDVSLTYNKTTTTSVGWLNYLAMNARRQLIASDNQMHFRDVNSVGAGKVGSFNLAGASAASVVWDITNPVRVVRQAGTYSNGLFQFITETDTLKEFIVFNNTEFKTPVSFRKVANQNLHGVSHRDMIIVSPPTLLSEAERLAEFHRTHDTLKVEVVTPQKIYNEFSSGAQDISAIRDFIKMLYDRAGADTVALPKYLLLFGDASYNYKRIVGNTNLVPTYESINSLAPINSFVTDDYYGLLDDSEGIIKENHPSEFVELLDLNIGRFPIQTLDQARVVVDKVINYVSPKPGVQSNQDACINNPESGNAVFGDWRNVVSFIADDEDGAQHLSQADTYASYITQNYKEYNIEKVFFDAYRQISTPGGQRFPDVNDAINKRIEKGALIINYTGHGGELGWAHERVLEVADINAWANKDKLPLFMTATCEFSRFDDPDRTSAGELVFLNPNGGGIALLTTVRLVYSNTNGQLNDNFYKNVFNPINGRMPTMGQVFTITKNKVGSNRNFTLLGDPAVRLVYPKYNVVTSSINGKAVTAAADTLRALSKVTISGFIEDNSGKKMTSFNGTLYPTIYDKPATVTTLGNDPPSTSASGSPVTTFRLQKNVLYKGKVSVVNGAYSFSFLIPKDISYQYGFGKISYYAENGSIDANGYYDNIIIGGSSSNMLNDAIGPEVKLFMNDDKFVFGGTTDENPILQAVITDSSGVNTVGNGIGHDVTAILDGDISNLLVLNDYYQADLNSYQKGKVSYRLSRLSEGKHSVKFKVWDVNNNSSESYLEFVVSNSAAFALKYVLNYPNPFTTKTSFYFEHNKPCVPLDVQVQIYTISGKLIKTIESDQVHSEGYRIGPIDWDGKDDFGDNIGKGVYVYRLKVRSSSDGKTAEKFEKLVILN